MLTGCGEGPQRLADAAAPRRSADLDAANGKYARKCGHRLNLVPGDRVQQPAREVRIEPAELHSILVRGGLVGLILAPPALRRPLTCYLDVRRVDGTRQSSARVRSSHSCASLRFAVLLDRRTRPPSGGGIIPVDDVNKGNLTLRYESPVGRDDGRRRESRIASG
jgi:hypothetical protein